MKMCMDHWTKLRTAIDTRGLSALVSESGEEAMSNLLDEANRGPTLDNFDPLLTAHNAIFANSVHIDPHLALLDECPLCHLNHHHDDACQIQGCKGTPFEGWIDAAADEAADAWVALKP